MARTIHPNILCHQLTIILVWSRHIHLKSLLFRLMSQGPNHIISFITRYIQHRDIHCFKKLLDTRNRPTDILWCLLSLCLVLLIRLMAESRTCRIKSHSHMSRLDAFDQILKRHHKTKNSRSILSVRVHSWSTDKSIIRAIDHRIRIYEQ